jgi:hypothetical protein
LKGFGHGPSPDWPGDEDTKNPTSRRGFKDRF